MKPRHIQIVPVLNGFIIQVGCQTVVFDDIDKMGAAIVKYYRNPEATEKDWLGKPLNNMMEPPLAVPSPLAGMEQVSDRMRAERRPQVESLAVGSTYSQDERYTAPTRPA